MKILYGEYPNFPKPGVDFIDLTPSLLDSKVTDDIVEGLMELYSEKKDEIDYIVSPDARGFIWGGMAASKYGIGFIPVRKPGKLPDPAILSSVKYETEYSSTELCMPLVELKDKKLLFVDDVYATGGTYNAVKKIILEQNGILLGGSVVVDVELDKNPEIKSLTKAKDLNKN